MLKLTVKPGRWVTIIHNGQEMRLKLSELHGEAHKIVFDAPEEFDIRREGAVKDKQQRVYEAVNRA